MLINANCFTQDDRSKKCNNTFERTSLTTKHHNPCKAQNKATNQPELG